MMLRLGVLLLWVYGALGCSRKRAASGVCYDAKRYDDADYFQAPASGTLSGVEFVWIRGSVTCDDTYGMPYTRWSCWGYDPHSISIMLFHLEDTDYWTGERYYPNAETGDVTSFSTIRRCVHIYGEDHYTEIYDYRLTGYKANSEKIVLKGGEYSVTTDDYFTFGFGEAWCEDDHTGNVGEVCADVYFYYGSDCYDEGATTSSGWVVSDESTSGGGASAGIIAGAVIGAVCGLLCMVLCIYWIYKKMSDDDDRPQKTVTQHQQQNQQQPPAQPPQQQMTAMEAAPPTSGGPPPPPGAGGPPPHHE